MITTTIRTPPSVRDFIPLADYESQTPESFADGKPVLHFHLEGATAQIPKSQCGTLAVFPADSPAVETQANGQDESEELVAQKVDIFVTSQHFIIFSQEAAVGVSLAYPSISIHALKQVGTESSTQAVWMQVEVSAGGSNDDEFDTVELTILPPASSDSEVSGSAQKMYDAMSACSDLNPDEEEDEDEDNDRIVFEPSAEHEALAGFHGVLHGSSDGTLPPPMPGSGGWITADNMHEFFDDDGNWLGRDGHTDDAPVNGELGEGAGRTRDRDELESEGMNGHDDGHDEENKRPRVE
ncbi:hypothetical protein RJ55_00970 [Drechmeria coniospora]|nr:hypothetical protein RJ55_00970 [Drechmeria coniospora]